LTFFLIRAIPGGPFDREREPPPHVKEMLLEKYGLDGSAWSQYTRYLGDLVQGDLRVSFKYRNRSVREILADSLPVSFVLGGVSFVLALGAGVLLGTYAAVRRNSVGDYGAMMAALLAISLPTFVTGPVLIFVFALWLGWLPVGGWGTVAQLVLPAICLAAPYAAYIARLMRNSMLEVLNQDFVRTARAKGLDERSVIYKHALKVAILPVVSFAGPLAAHLLTGSIVVEQVFAIPGAGSFFVNSIQNRDGFLLSGVVIVYCTLLVVFNFLVDVSYGVLDKRVRSGK
ncbi:MAG: ABC transporter permease, partial [Verrucomicrobiales bacterium]|nr:ABC transporter permease [Verrucomicrobiales bacterium]